MNFFKSLFSCEGKRDGHSYPTVVYNDDYMLRGSCPKCGVPVCRSAFATFDSFSADLAHTPPPRSAK